MTVGAFQELEFPNADELVTKSRFMSFIGAEISTAGCQAGGGYALNLKTDRPEGIEVRSSRLRLLMLTILGVAMTWGCWLIAIHKIGDLQAGDPKYWVICFGVLFFGLCTLVIVWRLLHSGEVLLQLSSDGVWIKEFGGGLTVPWGLVNEVSRAKVKRSKFLVLQMTDENYASLKRGGIRSGLFKLNKLVGMSGISLSVSGTSVSIEELEAWVLRYWNNWKTGQNA